jgi:hypothetical protein
MALKTKSAKGGLRAAKAMPAKGKIAKGGLLGGRGGVKAFRAIPKRGTVKAGAKVGAGAAATRPYVQTLMRDEDVRDNLEDAYRALTEAYGRISSRGDVAEAVLDDRRTRRHLKSAAHSMREAAATVRGAKQAKRRKQGTGVVLVLVAAGGAAAIALNDDLRGRVLSLVGLGEDESGAAPQGSNGSQPTSVQPEGAPPTAATSQS